MKRSTLLSALLLATAPAFALAQSIDFKVGGGSRAQQLATVESVTDFETFTGRTDKVTGTIRFDPKARKGSGRIVVDAASIDTGIDLRNDHMRSGTWLDTGKNPEIVFDVTNARHRGGDRYEVTGNFTLKGVTKQIKTTVTVRYLAASDSTRRAGFKGDVLQVRGSFPVKLADHNVTLPPPAVGKVGETVTVSFSLYAQSGS